MRLPFAILLALLAAAPSVAIPPNSCLRDEFYNVARDRCDACPRDSFSSPGSIGMESCQCAAGFWMDLSRSRCTACNTGLTSSFGSTSADQCVCNVNTYGTAATTCSPCPTSSTSPVNTTTITGCKCDAYFYGLPGSTCTACPPSSYSPQDTQTSQGCLCPVGSYFLSGYTACTTCPAGATSPGGRSTGLLESCTCNYPLYLNDSTLSCATCTGQFQAGNGTQCSCDTGYYDNAGTCTACPAGSVGATPPGPGLLACKCTNPAAFVTPTGCQTCPANSTSLGTSCQCNADTYYSDNQCISCPLYAEAPPGSTSCTCRQPYHQNISGVCTLQCPSNLYADLVAQTCLPCPINTYLSGGSCAACPAYAMSQVGSTSFQDCVCAPGTIMEGGVCAPCGKGNICPNSNGTRISCAVANPTAAALCARPLDTLTSFSINVADCVCIDAGKTLHYRKRGP